MEGVKGLYGAPSLALGLVLKQEWARSLAAQARVGQHGLVSRQSVGECPVQGGAVVEALREMAEALRPVVGEDAPGGGRGERTQRVEGVVGVAAGSVGLGERLLPALARAPADPAGLPGRGLAVPGPDLQNGESVLSLFGCPLPSMPDLRSSIKPLEAEADLVDVHGPSSCFEKCHRFLNLYRVFCNGLTPSVSFSAMQNGPLGPRR